MATTERQGFPIVDGKASHLCPVAFCRHAPHRPGDLCSRHKMRAWRAAHPIKAAFAHLRESAEKRGIAFDLTLLEFTVFCAETDYIARKGREAAALHVDRIRDWEGYNLDNIQVLTCSENTAKGNRDRWLKHRLEAYTK